MLLEAYVRSFYDGAPADERAQFERLLELEDPLLYGYLTAREQPEDAGMRRVIAKVRAALSGREGTVPR